MLNTIFATKIGMSQAWLKSGKRLPITKLLVEDNIVLSAKKTEDQADTFEIGYGKKKLKNMTKPLAENIKKSGFSFGVKQIRGIKAEAEELKVGETVKLASVLEVGDIVEVQGTSKGRGFAGAMKRYGFHGGPRTHGQSDRARAVGSIGSGTDPGRVWKGKKMPGHYGVETKTVSGLVVAYIDEAKNEVWLSGPVPGFNTSIVRIQKTGKKRDLELNLAVLGLEKKEEIAEVKEEVKVEAKEEAPVEKVSAVVEESKAEKKEETK